MFDFFRSLTGSRDDEPPAPAPNRPLAARRRPALTAEEVAPPTAAAHWDIWLELDGRDRVVAHGGRQVHRLLLPAGGSLALPVLGDYLERRVPGSMPLTGLRGGERVDLALRSTGDLPLVCRFQAVLQADEHCLLLGTDISDLNWQSDNQQHKLQCLNLSKLLLARLRHSSQRRLNDAVGEVLESFCGAFQMRSMALALESVEGVLKVFACHLQPGLDSLLREGLTLPDGELRRATGAYLLETAAGPSELLRMLCCECLYLVPAPVRGGRLAGLLAEPAVPGGSGAGPQPGDWQYLAEILANLVHERSELHSLRDSSRRLNLLQDMVGGGWWRMRMAEGVFELSPAVAACLGLAAGQGELALADLLSMLHPADADELSLRLRNLQPGARLVQDLRLRARASTQTRRWLRLQGRMQARAGDQMMDGVLLDISEGKLQEEQALAAHARLRNLIDSAPVVIYVQRVEEGHLIPEFYSESAGNLLGLDLQGQSWQALAERVHPEDLEIFLARGRELLREGRVRSEYRLCDSAGEWHWLYDEAKLLRDIQGLPQEAVGLWLDVTEQHLAALQIAESEERYRVLVEDSPALICRYAPDLTLTFINHTFAQVLDEPVEALLGRRLDEWVSAQDCSALRARLVGGDVPAAGDDSWELRFSLPGQRNLWLVWADRPLLDVDGRLLEVQAVGRDNTAVRRAQQQLAQGAKMASLGEMVSGMTHEMKQPLHVMRMALYNARQRLEDVGYLTEKIERADAQIDRLSRVVGHMGVFSRTSELEMSPFDPFQACEGTLELMGDGLTQQGILLECRPPAQRVTVCGFSDQLEQVLINLLANARDALLGREGEGARWIGLSQEPCADPGWVELHVRDNAGGIDEALMERIFEPFFTTKPIGKGTGLGLSVSHDLIRNMGGSLSVDNYKGGARFRVRLPLQPAIG
ncbi:sensory box histidine kinase [Pseudomonas sp. ATCC 13867]|uniref:PAS domain-containing sensor histidine kinase n=1 Tax=Pseudomonas sp. ATCC 13867 TaxID=1294143 RepID=UPI0002C4F19E|nr:PAS domain-containing sensor histidine kinase [Pseudomonas sp. ATCC 13867]AGI23056.1 sensory box histidine kinase [Pseudomonas sp. ATCC 13867]